MAINPKELAMMDTYFKNIGMAHLWTNIKKLMTGGSGCDCDKEAIEQALLQLNTSLTNLQTTVSKIDVQPANQQDIDNLFK